MGMPTFIMNDFSLYVGIIVELSRMIRNITIALLSLPPTIK